MYLCGLIMSNDYFRFKKFTIRQHLTAMKVGTDGTLLGAWANGGARILDIGTGTGLIALMMAQRFPNARLTAIDIDSDAVQQAEENINNTEYSDRITIVQGDIRCASFDGEFDAIVTNPPYFNNALPCSSEQRSTARHTTTLSYRELMTAANRLLSDDGELSVVIPSDCRQQMISEAVLLGFFLKRECSVQTTPNKAPRRYLLSFVRHSTAMQLETGVIETSPGNRSEWYDTLTRDFYL